jgi:type 1 glutamine amidotransferase
VAAGLVSFLEPLRIEVVDATHPITAGLQSWEMLCETWRVGGDPGPAATRLLRTTHPTTHLTALAWTHHFRAARVFCLQPGHNNDDWSDPSFRAVLGRGLHWAAGRL